MLKILSRIIGSDRAEVKDAKQVYKKIMVQSRKPEFYGEDLCADTTDGRMEILCLHLATVMHELRTHDKAGAKLSQAVYDVMIDDFDIALREEGLSDTGVSRRIKLLATMFFTRAKQYSDAFDIRVNGKYIRLAPILDHICKTESNVEHFVQYTEGLLTSLNNLSLGQIALGEIDFPKFH